MLVYLCVKICQDFFILDQEDYSPYHGKERETLFKEGTPVKITAMRENVIICDENFVIIECIKQ